MVKRAHGTVQAQLRASYLTVQDRMKVQGASHLWHAAFSTDVAALSLDGGALPS